MNGDPLYGFSHGSPEEIVRYDRLLSLVENYFWNEEALKSFREAAEELPLNESDRQVVKSRIDYYLMDLKREARDAVRAPVVWGLEDEPEDG